MLLFIKLAPFRKICKPTVAKAGKCLPVLHLCSEGRGLAYENKQANLGNSAGRERQTKLTTFESAFPWIRSTASVP